MSIGHRNHYFWAHTGIFWSFLWFWKSVSSGLPLIFPEELYWVSAAGVIITVGLCALFVLMCCPKPFRFNSCIGRWVFVYLGWIAFVSVLSPYVAENPLRTIGFFTAIIFTIVAMLIGSRLLKLHRALTLAARGYILGLALTTVLLLVSSDLDWSERFGNMQLLHPNKIGPMYALALSFLLFLPVYRMLLVRFGLALGFALGLVLTFSKTTLLALALSVVVAVFFQRGWRKLVSLVAILALGGMIFWTSGDFLQQQVENYFGNPSQVGTLTGRTLIWAWVLEKAGESPLIGYGYATFRNIFASEMVGNDFSLPLTQAHNAYLDALFTGGYLALFLFSFLLFRMVVIMLRTSRFLRGSPVVPFFVAVTEFMLIRSITEGGLNLGWDFVVLSSLAFLAEAALR